MKNRWRSGVIVCISVAILLFTAGSALSQVPGAQAAWPNSLTIHGATVVVYQPQAVEWPNHETLTTREAIAITLPGEKSPVLGTTEISFTTQTDAASGDVILTDPHLVASHFPALDTAQAERIEDGIRKALP